MIRFWVQHPVATWMLLTALIICGVYALPHLSIEAMPELELPSLTIVTSWTGASPKAIQRSITVPIEEAVRRVHGVEEVTARSSPGRSEVEVAFRRGTNLDFARLDLSEQLGAVRRSLPAMASQPVIIPYVPEEFRATDFLLVSLISPLPTNVLRERAEDWILPRLLAVPGVADVELQGGAMPVLRVLLDLGRMERYGLTADEIYGRLEALDDILPAGAVRSNGREFTVSIQDSVTQRHLREAVIRTVGGQPITLGHVARLEPGYEDPGYFVRINGESVIQASIAKRSGENAVGVSRAVRRALPEIKASVSFPISFEIDDDQGEALEKKLDELIYRSLIILALLFLLLAVALRRIRLTAIVIVSILFAVVICLSLYYFFGMSVNFITISGLTVCFGMLLDNSILVLDAIHRHLGQRRTQAVAALISGAREAAFPIMATTLTNVVAFLSFTFLSGRLSLYYVPLAASVGIAMLASIFVAFCWIPVAMRGPAERERREQLKEEGPRDHLRGSALLWRWGLIVGLLTLAASGGLIAWKGMPRFLDQWIWLAGIAGLVMLVGVLVSYIERVIALSLRFWWIPVGLVVLLFAGSGYIFKTKIHEGGFFRQEDQESLQLYLERPVGTDVVLASETMKLFEDELLPIPDGIHMRSVSFENRGFMRIKFEPEMLRTEFPQLFRNRLILLAEELGGIFIYIGGFGDPYLKGGTGGGLSNSLIRVTGYNSARLNELCEGVIDKLERNRRVRGVRLTSGEQFERASSDETVVLIRRDELDAHHLSVAELMGHLRRLLGIETPWRMMLDGEDQRVQLSFSDASEIQYDQVMDKVLTTRTGEKVRLGDVISLETRPVLGSINRKDQKYTMQINWEYIGTDRMRQGFIQEVLGGLKLPYGYTAEDVSGEQLTAEEKEEMKTVLWLTVLFIFMTLAILFESIGLPILVMLSVPMSLVGVAAIFWAADASFDSSAKIGLVLMYGVVVNNAILLLNRFRMQVRELIAERGYGTDLVPQKPRVGASDLWRLPGTERIALLRQAIVDGTRIQLRAILLTSGTNVAGLLPLLVQLKETTGGRDIWENLALSSIGGMVSSTLLIIGTMPAIYYVLTRLGWAIARLWQRVRRRSAAAAPSVSPEPESA
jgi:HAE1 family hydrophobic/amphiphilic exporter-1